MAGTADRPNLAVRPELSKDDQPFFHSFPGTREMIMPIQQVYLIRHGETEWSLSGQHTGVTDIPLTENGRKVAKLLEPVLAKENFALVLTSPLSAFLMARIAGRSAPSVAGKK